MKIKVRKLIKFIIKLDLPDERKNPEQNLSLLYDAGCINASIGVNKNGFITLVFSRTEVTSGTCDL